MTEMFLHVIGLCLHSPHNRVIQPFQATSNINSEHFPNCPKLSQCYPRTFCQFSVGIVTCFISSADQFQLQMVNGIYIIVACKLIHNIIMPCLP